MTSTAFAILATEHPVPRSAALILGIAVLAIALLLFLIIAAKWQPFVALLFVSLIMGLAAGMAPLAVVDSVVAGMGGTLGMLAIVVALGAMFGQMLEVSGGAERLAQSTIRTFGEKRAQWALVLTGFLLSIPVFFDVGLVILIALIYSLSRKANRSLLYYGIPLMAGMAVTHAFVPPTPGPVAAAQLVRAELGWVIVMGVIAGIPAAIIAGPIFGTFIARRIYVPEPEYMAEAAEQQKEPAPTATSSAIPEPERTRDLPSFGLVALLILLPIAMIVGGTIANVALAEGAARTTLTFLGHPIVALLLVTLLTLFLLGTLRGIPRERIQTIATKALEPAGIIILVTGAGGVFKQVLQDSGVGEVLKQTMSGWGMHPILLAYLVAAFIRVAQGSATVAMQTSAGIVASMLVGLEGPALALIVIAIAAGATLASHVNDSGFWIVNRFFGMSVKETLMSWTIMTTLISLVGFAVVAILSMFVSFAPASTPPGP